MTIQISQKPSDIDLNFMLNFQKYHSEIEDMNAINQLCGFLCFAKQKVVILVLIYTYSNTCNFINNKLPQLFDSSFFLPMTEPQQNLPPNLSSSRTKSTVNGLKQLLNASNECEYVKKRIKVLENIQNHNQAKVRQYKLSLDKFQQVKVEKQQSIQAKQRMMKKMKQREQEQKEYNMKNKHQRKNKISEVLRQIEDEKIRDRNKIREQSQNIAWKIQKNRQKQLMQKRQRRNRVVQIQRECKQNYKTFFQHKKEDLARRAQIQLSQLQQRKKEKQEQIQNMNVIESVMLNKQNETKCQFSSVKSRLAEIYGVQNKNIKSSFSMHCRDQSHKNNTQDYRISKA